MFFLKKRPKGNVPANSESSVVKDNEPFSVENSESNIESVAAETTTNNIPENPNQYVSSLGKMFRNQHLSFGPNDEFENEAWAPENQSVGLFRKNRGIVEEQISSSSGPQ